MTSELKAELRRLEKALAVANDRTSWCLNNSTVRITEDYPMLDGTARKMEFLYWASSNKSVRIVDGDINTAIDKARGGYTYA